MFDAWKQRQRQRLENRPERTVFYNIFATMMLVLAVELLMAVASILAINVTEQLDENAKECGCATAPAMCRRSCGTRRIWSS